MCGMRYSTPITVSAMISRYPPMLACSPPPLTWAALLLALGLLSCGGGGTATPPPPIPSLTPLSAPEVESIVKAAASSVNAPLAVAVVDRTGKILAVWRNASAPTTGPGNFFEDPDPSLPASVTHPDANELAVALARTAAFFSNNQAPLSSRTVRFISGIHFPPGVAFTGNADLYGIENTNRGCSFNTTYLPGKQFTPSLSIDGTTNGLGILTGKGKLDDSDPNAVNPGGVPLFKSDGAGAIGVVGGIGVVSSSTDIAEYAAFQGASLQGTPFPGGFLPSVAQLPPPGIVVVGGISLPFVNQTTAPAGIGPGSFTGSYLAGHSYPLGGGLAPDGDLVGQNGGSFGLTASDVATIVTQAVAAASVTRAVIRLPQGSRTRMSIAVADLDGNLLALHRMPDGTVFSLDVAVANARNVIWFSSAGSVDLPGIPAGTAVTNRTISFGAQPLFPAGIDGSGPGPFYPLFLSDTKNPCTQGSQPANANQNGIVFFPGSLPLYKNGVLVGGLGVSGDGVDQDDYVTFQGAQGFLPPDNIHADNVIIDGVRMPYLKFPRNPTD